MAGNIVAIKDEYLVQREAPRHYLQILNSNFMQTFGVIFRPGKSIFLA